MKEKINWPLVSIIVCTFNCKDHAQMCFEALQKQDYPKDKLEFIAIDGYSTDGTVELLKELGVKTYFSNDRPERGAKTLGYQKANGKILIYIDSDNEPLENDWIKKIIKPLLTNKAVGFCISRIAVVQTDKLLNQYLSLTGPDPFVNYCFIDAYLSQNKLKLEDHGEYFAYPMTPKTFITTGGNYFTVRKETLDQIGGYTQDTDVGFKLTKIGMGRVGIPKNAHLHHHITTGYVNFWNKKVRWGKIFFNEQRFNREFNWIPDSFAGKGKVVSRIMFNLLSIPNLVSGIYRSIKFRNKAWILHPIMVFMTTVAYVYSFILCKLNQGKV
jgi:glycosyltransferase involved in cell wall biosynthesis